jgi:hypothetical protein
MSGDTSWNDSQFDEMSWHDNHVHGLRIREGEHGCGELDLDLDYILEWLCPTESSFAWRVAPATLTFREVFDLRIEIDYAAASAGITPFSISGIARAASKDGISSRWTIELNWPKGALTFTASGFRQTLRAEPNVSATQGLGPERARLDS